MGLLFILGKGTTNVIDRAVSSVDVIKECAYLLYSQEAMKCSQ